MNSGSSAQLLASRATEASPVAAPKQSLLSLLRHQLPVFSPLPLRSVLAALAAAPRTSTDPREELRKSLCSIFAADQAVLCGSGTEALQLAIRSALPGTAREALVALPAFSCYDVATAGVATGARLCFYDLDPATLEPDLDSLRSLLRSGACVVVVSPLYGIPVSWTAVASECAAHGATLIEDAAQAAGGSWQGRPLGGLGELSVLSFGRGKGWSGGRGGALLLRAAAALARPPVPARPLLSAELAVLATALAQALLGRPSLYAIPRALPRLRLGDTVYHEPRAPRAMPRSAAAIAWRSLDEAIREATRRREVARSILTRIRQRATFQALRLDPDADPGFLRLPIRAVQGMNGFSSPERALRAGISPSYPLPLPRLPQVQHARVEQPKGWAGAEQLARELITLPTHSRLSTADVDEVLHLVNTYRA